MESGETWRGGPRPELRALTGLRGVAAAVVAIAHFRPPLPYSAELFFMWENAAVDLFFCLSGFTLSYVYRREDFQFSSYLLARIARIYPLYFITLILVGGAYIWPTVVNPTTYPAAMAISDSLRQVLLLNSWPAIGSGVHWNFPAWSISVEWLCYLLLFPVLLLKKPPRSENFKLICFIGLSAVSYALFMNYFDERIINAEIYAAKSQWSYLVNVIRGVVGFTAGWIAFSSFEEKDDLYRLCTRFSTEIWLGFLTVLVLWYVVGVPSQMLVFLFPFVVLAATDPTSTMSRVLGSGTLHFLGVISYSIYLTHFIIVIGFIVAFSAPDTWSMSTYALLVGTTFVISTGTYFVIERPARNAIRGIRRRRFEKQLQVPR